MKSAIAPSRPGISPRMSAASKQGGTEVSYLGVQGSPSLTPPSPLSPCHTLRSLAPLLNRPAPSRFPPQRARSCWRNPTRRGARRRRRDACPSARESAPSLTVPLLASVSTRAPTRRGRTQVISLFLSAAFSVCVNSLCVCLCESGSGDDAPDILPSPPPPLLVAPFVWMRNMCQFRGRVVMPLPTPGGR